MLKLFPTPLFLFILAIHTSTIAKDLAIISLGTDQSTRFEHSENTLLFSPGIAFLANLSITHTADLEFKYHRGFLFGYDHTISVTGSRILRKGKWSPSAGVQLFCKWGKPMYHRNGPEYLDIAYPQTGLGITLSPVRFLFTHTTVSILETTVGTSFQYPGKILNLDFSLLKASVHLLK